MYVCYYIHSFTCVHFFVAIQAERPFKNLKKNVHIFIHTYIHKHVN